MAADWARVADASWRAAAYCLHPRLMLCSLLPLALSGALVGGLAWWQWEAAVAAVRAALERWALVEAALQWLDAVGVPQWRTVLAPLLVVALSVPLLVLLTLLLVVLCVVPVVVQMVVLRCLGAGTAAMPLQRAGAPSAGLRSLGVAVGAGAAALLVLLFTLPLNLIPPVVLLLPPLVWGWLAAQVFGHAVLAAHATAAESHGLRRTWRWPLLAMGVVCGFMAGAPSLLWGLGAAALIFAPVLLLASLWLYTLVFSFAAAWFAHLLLPALAQQRLQNDSVIIQP